MNPKYFTWPLSKLGPKILSKEKLIDMFIAYEVFGNVLGSTKEIIEGELKHIATLKQDLNNFYSQLKRLEIPAEQEKLYSSYIQQHEMYFNNYLKLNDNVIKNQATIKEFLDDLNRHDQLKSLTLQFKQTLDIGLEPPAAPESKEVWLEIEKAHLRNEITDTKNY